MKEELLTEIRNELESEKNVLEKQNMEIKKIRQFEKDPIVKEYIKLRGLSLDGRKLTKLNIDDSIYRICCQNLYRIREEDTNGIYVYLGTYRCSYYCDIEHGPTDDRVDYNDSLADYRSYYDIEQSFGLQVPISRCKEFEESHIVINPKTYSKRRAYYDIQKEFFVSAVKTSQETAKKKILRKYPRLNRKV